MAEVSRLHVFAAHPFTLAGREYFWKQSKGEGEERVKRFYQRHLKCVDAQGNVLAVFYVESYRGQGDKRLVGRFEIQQEGLDLLTVESLLLTFLAVYVKLRKRAMQGMQAGNLGGLVTTALYAVQG